MDILERKDFKTMKWPNGQGIAHEAFHVVEDGKTLWRLSLAEVVGDCVFSKFAGQMRCTTVVSGEGMDLTSAEGTIALRPMVPVTFSGELPLTGVLLDGPVENLNVVYAADRLHVEVTLHNGQTDLLDGDMLFVVSGEIILNNKQIGAETVVRLDKGAPVSGTGEYLLIRMQNRAG